MFFGRKTNRRDAASTRTSSRFAPRKLSTGLVISASLLAGCGETSAPLADIYANYEPEGSWQNASVEVTPQALPSQNDQAIRSQVQPRRLPAPEDPAVVTPAADYSSAERSIVKSIVRADHSSEYWSFPTDSTNDIDQQHPQLVPLPSVAELPAFNEQVRSEQTHQPEELLVARLLPPRPLIAQQLAQAPEPSFGFDPQELAKLPATTPHSTSPIVLPTLDELSGQEQLLVDLLRDSSSAATGVLTDQRVSELAKTKIQHAYAMASRGSLYVARRELIEVLRMLSQAKDAEQGSPERSLALSAGLRALREAEDFAPSGTQLEAELDIDVLCASHRTPIAKQAKSASSLPRIMMDRYLRYAQLQLAMSVAGEPAGSMALHALGKINSQLGRTESNKHRLAERHAIAYQQAALLAHNQNYLAAHELGVLLATSGHYSEAQQLLLQVAAREPNAIVYRNLARVQENLGQSTQAVANRGYAKQLSQLGATGTNNVRWVSPNQFADARVQTPRYTTAQRPAANQPPLPGSRQPMPPNIRR